MGLPWAGALLLKVCNVGPTGLDSVEDKSVEF
jgi:hypothetical protein